MVLTLTDPRGLLRGFSVRVISVGVSPGGYLCPPALMSFISVSLFVRLFACVSVCMSKGKGLDTCYSAAYMSQTRDQQRFTIAEVAADWHEPLVSQRIMWPSITRDNGQLDPRCS